ncbi:TetR/AcrR family transcriptional regulator [Bauldia litoralis]|nr:TetR/AcrR family transcriptional regulator [Bauldia litoralis]
MSPKATGVSKRKVSQPRMGRPPRNGDGGAEPGANRDALLAAARLEFARHGFAGARVGRICEQADTNVRMVYHYFGSKSGLYIAVLEAAMADLRAAELKLDVDVTEPLVGLLQLFDFIHDHFDANPQLISLLSAENLMQARYLKQSGVIPAMSSPVPKLIQTLVKRGVADGTVRKSVDPLRLYVMMVALSYFHLSNAPTLSAIFDEDLARGPWRERQRRDARQMIERFLRVG